jgi:hypothetical protein
MGKDIIFQPSPQNSTMLTEYLRNFHKIYTVKTTETLELEQWCREFLGKEYKNWMLYQDKHLNRNLNSFITLYIKNPKLCLIFEIKWSQAIYQVDSPNQR